MIENHPVVSQTPKSRHSRALWHFFDMLSEGAGDLRAEFADR